jgi:hypothetical protein
MERVRSGDPAGASDARIERLDLSHPIFNTFFQIDYLKVPYPGRLGERGLMGESSGSTKATIRAGG